MRSYTDSNYYIIFFYILFGLLLTFTSSKLFAIGGLVAEDYHTILRNLRKIVHPVMIMLMVASFVSGVGMFFKGLALFKKFGMNLNQSAGNPGELSGPLVYICVGTVLIYLPTSTDIALATIFGTGTDSAFSGSNLNLQNLGTAEDIILSYDDGSDLAGQWVDLLNTIILYIQLVGFIAFIRGWFIIAKAGMPGMQPGSISKGIIHIIGGVIALNFVDMWNIVHNSLFA